MTNSAATPLLLRNARAFGFAETHPDSLLDILIGADGNIAAIHPAPSTAAREADVVDLQGAYLSPGWVDLHTHVYHGGTDIGIRTREIGASTGVATLVDAGSAGEANFIGFREYVAEPARENIFSFLNVGSIGLVACNRVSELAAGSHSIDVPRMLNCIDANRDIIRGVKVRASGHIVGTWGLEPAKIAKKVAKLAKLPLMVHIGEMPPLCEDVFALLTPGDIITHCFHGKRGANILEDDELFAYAERLAREGIVLDIGHGAASFSYEVGVCGLRRGLYPTTISSDLHLRNLNGPVWDLSLVMSKLLSLGMPLEDVIRASSINGLKAIAEPWQDLLTVGTRAVFTAFTVEEDALSLPDAMGYPLEITQRIKPRYTVLGNAAIPAASRHPGTAAQGGHRHAAGAC
jgi:dihydroorotase